MQSSQENESSVPKNNIPRLVTSFSRNIPASTSSLGFGLIKNIFSEALEYKGIADGTRGALLFLGAVTCMFILVTILYQLDGSIKRPGLWGSHVILFIYTCVALPFGVYFFLKNLRLELFRPWDEPIIFDRKNRKVYRVFREVIPGWRGLLKKWPLKCATYDWKLIDAEHHASVVANTSTISRLHALVFIVRRSTTDQNIEDSFTLGSGLLGEVSVPCVYEHIRKFMEDDGAHVPAGETISQITYPSTIWQCLASVGPYGDNFKKLWHDHRIWLAVIIILYPLLFFIMTPIGVFSWLSYKTAIPIRWPQEIMQAVGNPAELASMGSSSRHSTL